MIFNLTFKYFTSMNNLFKNFYQLNFLTTKEIITSVIDFYKDFYNQI